MIGTPRRKRSGGMSQVPRIVFMRERILAALQDIELELTALPGIIAEPVIVALGRETGQLVPVPEPGAAPDIQSTPPEPAAYASELATAVHTRTADPAPVAATTALAAEAPGSGAASSLAPELARTEVALPASAVEPAGGVGPCAPGARITGGGGGADHVGGAGCCNPDSSAKAAANSGRRVPGAARIPASPVSLPAAPPAEAPSSGAAPPASPALARPKAAVAAPAVWRGTATPSGPTCQSPRGSSGTLLAGGVSSVAAPTLASWQDCVTEPRRKNLQETHLP
ncbi:mucin-1-like [Corvus hawaiiensis]|uniref:mucin-1-like n=1 Tax=Corvus hawaiiensis TaxID=134902 RepID=UPI0020198F97|nr:mucin-1-like [Corvus hawaiiensis]